MRKADEILKEINRKIDYYEEQEQIIVKTHPDHIRVLGSLKALRALKKWVEKE